MFEEILPREAVRVIESISHHLETFYLAGGTGLAIQLGHRKSYDFDFFTDRQFNTDVIVSRISPNRIFYTSMGTIHCDISGIRFSFLYYDVPLIYQPLSWHGTKLAIYKDIAAEKIKTISQRGSKKDFIDLYAVLKLKHSVLEVCDFFKRRFKDSGINFYHIVKSLVFFEDANQEPDPIMIMTGDDWKWESIKSFFFNHINQFEKELGVRA